MQDVTNLLADVKNENVVEMMYFIVVQHAKRKNNKYGESRYKFILFDVIFDLMQYRSKSHLLTYLSTFDAKRYSKSRNFVDGNVSHLSPYITHWIITTKECVQAILQRYTIKQAEKFLMELLRKEFFMHVQKTYGNTFTKQAVRKDKTNIPKKSTLPQSLIQWSTHTQRVNTCVDGLSSTWLLHNHQRMRLASRCCHRAKLDRKQCADRTYYHFIDGELSSNHLSRQRVNSTFANKAYFMNEENIQKYRPWSYDLDLKGSYDDIAQKLFDKDRKSLYRDEKNMYDTLYTPRDTLKPYTTSLIQWFSQLRILSPWKLDENLLWDDIPTLIVLDENFTKHHPRSKKRISFVQQYTQKYTIPLVVWSYSQIVSDAIQYSNKIILDERRDPFYRETQIHYTNHEKIKIIPYDRIYPLDSKDPILKFFKYRNKTTKYLKKMKEKWTSND